MLIEPQKGIEVISSRSLGDMVSESGFMSCPYVGSIDDTHSLSPKFWVQLVQLIVVQSEIGVLSDLWAHGLDDGVDIVHSLSLRGWS